MSANSNPTPGFLNEILKTAKNAAKTVANTVSPNNGTSRPPEPPLPASAGTEATIPPMKGGMAPINYRNGMQQPSEAVMKWATTAGAAMPPAAQMRGVAHGGRRRRSGRKTIRQRRYRKSKRATGGRRRKTHKRKTHRRRRN